MIYTNNKIICPLCNLNVNFIFNNSQQIVIPIHHNNTYKHYITAYFYETNLSHFFVYINDYYFGISYSENYITIGSSENDFKKTLYNPIQEIYPDMDLPSILSFIKTQEVFQ